MLSSGPQHCCAIFCESCCTGHTVAAGQFTAAWLASTVVSRLVSRQVLTPAVTWREATLLQQFAAATASSLAPGILALHLSWSTIGELAKRFLSWPEPATAAYLPARLACQILRLMLLHAAGAFCLSLPFLVHLGRNHAGLTLSQAKAATHNSVAVSAAEDFTFRVLAGVALVSTGLLALLSLALAVSWEVRGNGVVWVAMLVVGTRRRQALLLWWAACLALLLSSVRYQPKSGALPQIVIRKAFHVAAVAMFLPGIALDLRFLSLALAGATLLLLVLDGLRAVRAPGVGQALHTYMVQFTDERDEGVLILTHVYLLLGCAMPVWLAVLGETADEELAGRSTLLFALGGVLTVGIGDTAAAVVGRMAGRLPWPGSRKTVEGSAAGALSMLLCGLGCVAAARGLEAGARAAAQGGSAVEVVWLALGVVGEHLSQLGPSDPLAGAVVVTSVLCSGVETFVGVMDNLAMPMVWCICTAFLTRGAQVH